LIHLLDAKSGATKRTFDTGFKTIHRLQLSWQLGEPLAIFTAEKGGDWSTRLWNLATGRAIPSDDRYALIAGQQDKMLGGLAVSDGADHIRFAFASKYSKVMVADFPQAFNKKRFPFSEWHFPDQVGDYVRSLAAARCGETTLLAAGGDDGGIALWDFGSEKFKGSKANVHIGYVDAICFGAVDGRPAIISGGADGNICFWTPHLELILRIEIGYRISAMAWIGPDQLAVGGDAGVLMLRVR
jgi:WD40 repeat protein